MSSYLGPALLALTKGRQAIRERGNKEAEIENALKMQQMKMALSAAQKRQSQERATARDTATSEYRRNALAETNRHNTAMESAAANRKRNIDPLSEEGLAASARLAEAAAKIRARYRPTPPAEQGFSPADARKERAIQQFVDTYLDAYDNSAEKAGAAIQADPNEFNRAKSLGVQMKHWRAGVMRHKRKSRQSPYGIFPDILTPPAPPPARPTPAAAPQQPSERLKAYQKARNSLIARGHKNPESEIGLPPDR